jgi:hypothetical protein
MHAGGRLTAVLLSGSPCGRSTTRFPPMSVCAVTRPGCPATTLPLIVRRLQALREYAATPEYRPLQAQVNTVHPI